MATDCSRQTAPQFTMKKQRYRAPIQRVSRQAFDRNAAARSGKHAPFKAAAAQWPRKRTSRLHLSRVRMAGVQTIRSEEQKLRDVAALAPAREAANYAAPQAPHSAEFCRTLFSDINDAEPRDTTLASATPSQARGN
jgi:hypothetical protein